MARTHHVEVPMIETGQLSFAQPLGDGEDRRIDESDIRIGVSIAQLPNSGVIGGLKIFDRIRAVLDVGNERDEDAGVEALVDPVVDLPQDRGRNHAHLVGRLDQRPASAVIRVCPVEGGIQRARVENQRHSRGSGRSTAVRLAVPVEPEAPRPRLRGIG